jgi:hypothetical protein
MNTNKIRAAVAVATIAATLFAPSVAQANGRAESLRSGECSGLAEWKLKVNPQDRGLEVEYEIDSNRRGQQWRVKIFHGNRLVLREVRSTRGLSGSFTVREVVANSAGGDRFRARAFRMRDGQTCVGRVRF